VLGVHHISGGPCITSKATQKDYLPSNHSVFFGRRNMTFAYPQKRKKKNETAFCTGAPTVRKKSMASSNFDY